MRGKLGSTPRDGYPIPCAGSFERPIRGTPGFALEATGDFVGRGEWTLEQATLHVDLTYDWRIRADKPLLRRLSFLLKPVFAANHYWAMAKGEESLRLEAPGDVGPRPRNREGWCHLPRPNPDCRAARSDHRAAADGTPGIRAGATATSCRQPAWDGRPSPGLTRAALPGQSSTKDSRTRRPMKYSRQVLG